MKLTRRRVDETIREGVAFAPLFGYLVLLGEGDSTNHNSETVMKLFAIITAGLMATGGAVYFYSTSPCSKSGGCPLSSMSTAPVAKTGGCCSHSELTECGTPHDDSSLMQEASLAVATNVNASAGTKTVETGCCEACAVTPTFTIISAAKSVITAK